MAISAKLVINFENKVKNDNFLVRNGIFSFDILFSGMY